MSNWVPNRDCCSCPSNLCSKCAKAACEAADLAINSAPGLPRYRTLDPDAILPIPKIDWTLNESHATKQTKCGCSKQSFVTNVPPGYPEILPLPKMVW